MDKYLLLTERTFQHDPDESELEELARFLSRFGYEDGAQGLPADGDLIDIAKLIKQLPERLPEGDNAARNELENYYYTIPPRRRSKGVYKRARQLTMTLMERTEYLEGLARGLVRTCKGPSCVHFKVCPFKEEARSISESDDIDCMVDRGVIRRTIKEFVRSGENTNGQVDPSNPAQMLLFEQLIQLLVKQKRISMHLKDHEVLSKHYEILKAGEGFEQFDQKNYIEHPLLIAWDRTHKQIESLMKQMALTPEFQHRHGLWKEKGDTESAKVRARELVREYLQKGAERGLEKLKKGSAERKALKQLIEESRESAREHGIEV